MYMHVVCVCVHVRFWCLGFDCHAYTSTGNKCPSIMDHVTCVPSDMLASANVHVHYMSSCVCVCACRERSLNDIVTIRSHEIFPGCFDV